MRQQHMDDDLAMRHVLRAAELEHDGDQTGQRGGDRQQQNGERRLRPARRPVGEAGRCRSARSANGPERDRARRRRSIRSADGSAGACRTAPARRPRYRPRPQSPAWRAAGRCGSAAAEAGFAAAGIFLRAIGAMLADAPFDASKKAAPCAIGGRLGLVLRPWPGPASASPPSPISCYRGGWRGPCALPCLPCWGCCCCPI